MIATQWVADGFGDPDVLVQREVRLDDPAVGQVVVEVRASGMNPADYKHFGAGQDPAILPLTLGYEVAGVIVAIGPDTEIASGSARVGDRVIVFQVDDGYSSAIVAPAADVFAMPDALSFEQGANLLLAGTTAAELLDAARISEGDTVLLHGAAGAVGLSVLQQARVLGATTVGTASTKNFDLVRRLGGIPVEYGAGLLERARAAAPQGFSAALDTVGTDEAVDVSLDVLEDRTRFVSIAAFGRAADDIRLLGAGNPASGPFRNQARARIIELAAAGDLEVVMADTFPFADARRAVRTLMGPHPSGNLALVSGN